MRVDLLILSIAWIMESTLETLCMRLSLTRHIGVMIMLMHQRFLREFRSEYNNEYVPRDAVADLLGRLDDLVRDFRKQGYDDQANEIEYVVDSWLDWVRRNFN